jgi:hypothetical protein
VEVPKGNGVGYHNSSSGKKQSDLARSALPTSLKRYPSSCALTAGMVLPIPSFSSFLKCRQQLGAITPS